MATGESTYTERQFKHLFSQLSDKIKVKEKELYKVIHGSLSSTNRTNAYWTGVRTEINKIYAEIGSIIDIWAQKNIPLEFRNEMYAMNRALANLKNISNQASETITSLVNSQGSVGIQRILYEDAMSSILTGLEAGKNGMLRLTRMTQQKVINEYFFDYFTAEAIEQGNLQYGIGNIYRELINNLEEGQFVRIDTMYKTGIRAGQPLTLHYSPHYYAEMVARTKFHEAQAQSALLNAMNYQTDLIQVSWHNTHTAICLPYEGVIFSISGNSTMFPPLWDIPPYHPNCLHLLEPAFVEGLEQQGNLQEYSDFSLGKTEVPPIKNFIPVSLREDV